MEQQISGPARSGWRPGPSTPFPFLPRNRYFEWFAFAATPIGGCLAVNDAATGQQIIIATVLVSLVFLIPAGIRQLIYRLPLRAGRILENTVGGILVAFFIGCGLLGIWVIVDGYLK